MDGPRRGGGQGSTFPVISITEPNREGIVKILRRPKNPQARKRFYREATAYETLNHLGLPKLLDHNAETWKDRDTPMFMVLERIHGPTFNERVRDSGPFSVSEAVVFAGALSDILAVCHQEDIGHRDLKPSNIIMRDGDLSQPVVIDFGLSFNEQDSEVGDVTRTGEEVGNRFLRLPEHANGGRHLVSDLSQLVGVLYYVLAGNEPKVLVDEQGHKPHQRSVEAAPLLNISEPAQRRLRAIFDRGFDPVLLTRFQDANEFHEALVLVQTPGTSEPTFENLMSELDELVRQPSHADIAHHGEVLEGFVNFAHRTIGEFAPSKNLRYSQTEGAGVSMM